MAENAATMLLGQTVAGMIESVAAEEQEKDSSDLEEPNR